MVFTQPLADRPKTGVPSKVNISFAADYLLAHSTRKAYWYIRF